MKNGRPLRHLKLDELLPRRAEFGGLVTNLEKEARDAGATIVLNRSVDRAPMR